MSRTSGDCRSAWPWAAGTIIVIVLGLLLGRDPRALLQQLQGQGQAPPGAQVQRQDSPEEARKVSFVKHVLFETEQVWTDIFQTQVTGHPAYVKPKLVLFTGRVQSACGLAEAATGPFYCPGDQKVYIDLSFYDELANRFHAGGDFANAYVVAHEVGHHVQHLRNISPEREQQEHPPLRNETPNQLSVRLELQADFLAGIWRTTLTRSGTSLNRATRKRRSPPRRPSATTACKSRPRATSCRNSSLTAPRSSGSSGLPRASEVANSMRLTRCGSCPATRCEPYKRINRIRPRVFRP